MGGSRFPNARRFAYGALLAGALSACASAPRVAYDLSAATPARLAASHVQIGVRPPTATAELDTDRILVRAPDNSLAVLAGAQWADRLPSLIAARLTQTFQNAHGPRAVGEGGAAADYNLEMDLRAFELDAGAGLVDVDIAVKLVSAASGRVVATRIVKVTGPLASTAPDVATEALNQALSKAMVEIVEFVAKTL